MSLFKEKKTIVVVLLLASTVFLASCGDDGNPALPVQNNGDTLDWAQGSPLPVGTIGIEGAGTAVVNGKIYLVGGFERNKVAGGVWEYNPATMTWRPRAPMPTPRGDMGIAVLNGLIFTFGGRKEGGSNEIAVSNVERFNPETNSWTIMSPMPVPVGATVAVTAGTDIYLLGGWARNGVTGIVQRYIGRSQTWDEAAEMPTPRMYAAAGNIGHGIIVAGGELNDGPRSTAVESYSILTNSWSVLPSLSRGRSQAAACTIEDRFYIIGGKASEEPIYMSDVESYDPADKTWSEIPSLPLPASGHSAVVSNNQIYLFGGWYFDRDQMELILHTNLVVGSLVSN